MLRDEAYLLDMRLARDVLEFTRGVTFDQFSANKMMQYAVVRGVQIIGEAARQVSDELAASHPEVPWVPIRGMRHRLVHEYAAVDLEKVWRVVEIHIPELLRLLDPLIPREAPAKSEGKPDNP